MSGPPRPSGHDKFLERNLDGGGQRNRENKPEQSAYRAADKHDDQQGDGAHIAQTTLDPWCQNPALDELNDEIGHAGPDDDRQPSGPAPRCRERIEVFEQEGEGPSDDRHIGNEGEQSGADPEQEPIGDIGQGPPEGIHHTGDDGDEQAFVEKSADGDVHPLQHGQGALAAADRDHARKGQHHSIEVPGEEEKIQGNQEQGQCNINGRPNHIAEEAERLAGPCKEGAYERQGVRLETLEQRFDLIGDVSHPAEPLRETFGIGWGLSDQRLRLFGDEGTDTDDEGCSGRGKRGAIRETR